MANGSVHAMDQELMHILRLNIYLIVDLIYWKKKWKKSLLIIFLKFYALDINASIL